MTNNAESQNKQPLDSLEDIIQLVQFRLGEDEFGIDILTILEINRLPDILKRIDLPKYITGLTQFRNKEVPVINMRLRFKMKDEPANKENRILFAEVKGKVIGLLVDRVNGIIKVNKKNTEPAPIVSRKPQEKFVNAIVKVDDKYIHLLDVDKVALTKEVVNLNL